MTDSNKLENLLAELPTHPSPPGWQNRVRAAIAAGAPVSELRPPPLRWPRWIASGSVALAAAAVAVLYLGRPQLLERPAVLPRPEIAMRVEAHGSASRGDTARVGDTIVIVAEHADELRVYRDSALIARCPGYTGCRSGPRGFELTLEVTAHGTLSAIAFQPALPPDTTGASIDIDIGLAARVHSQMSTSALINVP